MIGRREPLSDYLTRGSAEANVTQPGAQRIASGPKRSGPGCQGAPGGECGVCRRIGRGTSFAYSSVTDAAWLRGDRVGEALVDRRIEPDGTVVIDLRGELDLAVEQALRQLMLDTVRQLRPPHLVIDMLHVSFVDSTGIGALVAGYKAAVAAGTSFRVRRLAPFVARQLKATGLHDRLTGTVT
jgi:anti-sigma B factor antagonist